MRPTCNLYHTHNRIELTHRFKKVVSHCSNPIHRSTKPCVVFWQALSDFNAYVEQAETTIRYGNNEFYDLDLCNDVNNLYREECKVYE